MLLLFTRNNRAKIHTLQAKKQKVRTYLSNVAIPLLYGARHPISSNNFTMRRSFLFIDEELNNLCNKIAIDL
jgi:hypothetical protein